MRIQQIWLRSKRSFGCNSLAKNISPVKRFVISETEKRLTKKALNEDLKRVPNLHKTAFLG